VAQGDGEWGLWLVPTHCLCAASSSAKDSSRSSPAPMWCPTHGKQSSINWSNVSHSHGLQISMNCPRVGPFHRVQSFRNRLLQHGLFSPWVHRSCQEQALRWASHGVTASFEHQPALAWGLPWAAGGDLLHCGHSWAAGAQPASPWSSPWAAGESLLRHLEHLLPVLFLH